MFTSPSMDTWWHLASSENGTAGIIRVAESLGRINAFFFFFCHGYFFMPRKEMYSDDNSSLVLIKYSFHPGEDLTVLF